MPDDSPVVRAMLERRSCRAFALGRTVDDASLQTIVRCGLAAPSSKGARPWRFHVVADRHLLQQLAALVDAAEGAIEYVPHDPVTGLPRPEFESTVSESAAVLRECAAAIFIENRGVFSRGRRTLLRVPPAALAASIVGYGLELVGIGTAAQNILLAARSFGLGATFMGDVLVAEPQLSAQLGVEGDLVGVVAMGHPVEDLPSRSDLLDPFDPALVLWHRS